MKESEAKVNINFKILSFGHAQIEIKSSEVEKKESKLKQTPEYREPKTTDQQIIEIILGGNDYKTPKTTGGLL